MKLHIPVGCKSRRLLKDLANRAMILSDLLVVMKDLHREETHEEGEDEDAETLLH